MEMKIILKVIIVMITIIVIPFCRMENTIVKSCEWNEMGIPSTTNDSRTTSSHFSTWTIKQQKNQNASEVTKKINTVGNKC